MTQKLARRIVYWLSSGILASDTDDSYRTKGQLITTAITRLEVKSISNRIVVQASEAANTRQLCLYNKLITAVSVSAELSGERAQAKK